MRAGVIITGGGRRVGAAMALYFAQKGHDIALHYHHSQTEAEAVQQQVRALGVACELFQQDLAITAELPALMKKIKSAMPHCTTLVNNASVFERCAFMETDEALFDRQFDVNLKAPFFLTQAFAKYFAGTVGANVVNIIDCDVDKIQVSHFAYLLSKKTLADFTLMAARALGPEVRVNAVCPGCMLPSNQNDEAHEEKMRALVPMRSHPSLDELSEAALWLSQQRHITGQLIHVDG